eukprot:CAMPEP_0172534504 /NCGR_PEP_ID=MMETSP1067-20121228/6842_1 /TAXON_ID=265564 ORGANISM="Thalassiosira punctigera, Strain Tpunct2005C2" /NCGR_SAMPLE_ID=MMETSP1067 /ASSEMBLY_ACC=CAM_ASM_000444 /LENGTH=540 /DNA_ID=CAMNT_0013319305 /DNA_START=155 /DNA_END=1777 /DNA_ORIENTATION=-
MFPFSSFFSSVHISERIRAFREAENHLFEFAKTRFSLHHQDESNHRFELFDTPIHVPSVVKEAAAPCQVHDDAAGANYSLHGVKVINKRLNSLPKEGDPTAATVTSTTRPAPLVLLHGYANGSLYFYRNLMGLSHHFGSVYALDMLGWGLSSRPKFDLLTAEGDDVGNGDDVVGDGKISVDTKRKVTSAESFFVESLESWRRHHDLPKLTLAGHSMGGYLSVAYAERYPQHVERLILLSPVGVPKRQPEDESRIGSLPLHVRAMIKTARYLFNKGITPGSFLRSLPLSKSKAMVDGYVLNRLPAITCPEERKHLGDYLYQNSMLPGSGEYCLNEILTAGAFAKIPLVDRIPNLETDSEEGMEVHMVYGERDWMDWRGGIETQRSCFEKRVEWERCQEQMKQEKKRQSETRLDRLVGSDSGSGVTPANKKGPPPRIFVHGVKDASHLLMLDNYEEFNAALIVASGGEGNLPDTMPRPVEFVCDEVARSDSHQSGSKRNVCGEEGASDFFRGGIKFNKGRKQVTRTDDTDSLEEKKFDEQLA